MSNISKQTTVFSNFIWRFLERFGAQIVTFVVSIVLARIMDPNVYGSIALVISIITILQVFVDGGLANALIQIKDADDIDFSTVFYFNMIVCLFLYVLIFFGAPVISSFYGMQELTAVVRVLSLTLVISGLKNVQQAYVSRNMLFKRFFFSTLIGTIGAAVIGIGMALSGFGIWALVAQLLFNTTVDTLILWITVKWRPKKCFSLERLKTLFAFGIKILLSKLASAFYEQIRTLFIGKVYSSDQLAYYNRGLQFPAVIEANLVTSIDSVLFPAMSSEQDNLSKVKNIARRSIKTSCYVMFPVMVGMAACAKTIISVILTDKWMPSAPFLIIFCIMYAFYPIITASWNSMKSIGRSGAYLFLELFRIISGLVALIITIPKGTLAIAIGYFAATLISLIPIFICNKKYIKYSLKEQISDFLFSAILSAVMGITVWGIGAIAHLYGILLLIFQMLSGAALYLLLSVIFRNENYIYLKQLIKLFISKRRNKA